MSRIKQALTAVMVGFGIMGIMIIGMSCCYSPAYYIRSHRAASDIVKVVGIGGGISQDAIDTAWKVALELGGGKPDWVCPVKTDRVIYVPSTLSVGSVQFYGITRWDWQPVGEKIEFVPTVEIHLSTPYNCHVKQVLVHELLHIVLTRREMADHTMAKDIAKYNSDQELMVRALYPIADMGVCGE